MRSPLNDGDQQQVSESGTPRVRERECKMKNEKHIKNNDDTKLFFFIPCCLLYSERFFPSPKKKREMKYEKMCAPWSQASRVFFCWCNIFLRAVVF